MGDAGQASPKERENCWGPLTLPGEGYFLSFNFCALAARPGCRRAHPEKPGEPRGREFQILAVESHRMCRTVSTDGEGQAPSVCQRAELRPGHGPEHFECVAHGTEHEAGATAASPGAARSGERPAQLAGQ